MAPYTSAATCGEAVERRARRELRRRHHAVLRRRDERLHRARREQLGGMAALVHQALDQAQPVVLVVDGETPGEAEQLRLAAEQSRGERVERTDPETRGIAPEQPADPLLHLSRGLVGEGDRKDPVGRHPVPVDQAGDPGGEDARLPRPRAGEHQQGTVHVLHGLPLRRIQGERQLGRGGVDHPTCVGEGNAYQETGSLFRVLQDQHTFVGILHDPPGEREADAPTASLARDAGLEQGPTNLLGDARPVVDHPHLPHALLGADPQDNRAAASLQRVDRVLHHRLQRPLQQHLVAQHGGPRAGCLEPELDGIGAARQPGPEVAGHTVGQRAEADRLALGRVADPLEPARHSIQALRIRRQVIRQVRRRRPAAIAPARSIPAGW